jgi:hypothetical protein
MVAPLQIGGGITIGGRLAIVNVYNLALSDAEVAQNFDYYRARFGL